MRRLGFLVFGIVQALAPPCPAADVQLLPPSVRLDGPRAIQRVLVEEREAGRWTADRTASAALSTDNPAVFTVAADGVLVPKGNGTATLTAKLGETQVRIGVSVENFERDEPRSFRNHVEPVLTRAGCNSGACHGAGRG